MRIFLIGMPGSGKSYWMRQVSLQERMSSIDLDKYIETREQQSIPELFAYGEAYFRTKETEALRAVIDQEQEHIIIATGGGTPCFNDNINLMKQHGIVIYLQQNIAALARNIENSHIPRPLLNKDSKLSLEEKLGKIYNERIEIYEQATVTIAEDSASLSTFAGIIEQYNTHQK